MLTVRADSTAWATQLRLLVPALLRRLAEEVGDGTVDKVRGARPGRAVVAAGPPGAPGRGPARHLRLRRSPEGATG